MPSVAVSPSPAELPIRGGLPSLIAGLERIVALADPAEFAALGDAEARRQLGTIRDVIAWHVDCFERYLEALGGPPVDRAREDARPPSPSKAWIATSRRLVADSDALGAAARAFVVLRRAARRPDAPSAAIVAALEPDDRCSPIGRLCEMIPEVISAEFRAMRAA